MTESLSPRAKPREARPRAKSRTWSRYSLHENVCQMPRSFSRMAGRAPNSVALRTMSCGSVRGSATGLPRHGALGIAQVGLDHGRVAAHLVRRALGDLLPHVEDGHAIGDVHDDPHVVLDEDDGRAPFLVDVEDEA